MREKTRVVHCMKEKYDVYIGRPGKWGNPYSDEVQTRTKYVSTKEEAIERYRQYILSKPDLINNLRELKGKALGCWCAVNGIIDHTNKPYICHGQVLCELVEQFFKEEDNE